MDRRLSLAAAAALILVAYTQLSRYLPVVGWRTGIALSALVAVPLFAAVIAGLWPLNRLGHWLLAVALGGGVAAVLFTVAGWVPGSNLGKALVAAGAGFWLALQIEELWWYVPVAAVSAGIDLFSVFAGPTKELLAHGPTVVSYFTVAMAWWGFTWHQAFTALGTSDLLFFALYFGAAERFGLRRRLTAACMAASFVITIVLSFWVSALPALPLLAVGFVAPNGDILWRALREARRGGQGGLRAPGRPGHGDDEGRAE